MTIPKQLLEAKICNKESCQEIERLNKELEETNNRALKIFKGNIERAKEITRLNNIINELEEENKVLKELNVCVGCEDNPTYKARIDKAIEQLQIRNRQNESALTNREETIISKHELLKREIIENDFLIGLLKGSDKE